MFNENNGSSPYVTHNVENLERYSFTKWDEEAVFWNMKSTYPEIEDNKMNGTL